MSARVCQSLSCGPGSSSVWRPGVLAAVPAPQHPSSPRCPPAQPAAERASGPPCSGQGCGAACRATATGGQPDRAPLSHTARTCPRLSLIGPRRRWKEDGLPLGDQHKRHREPVWEWSQLSSRYFLSAAPPVRLDCPFLPSRG